MSVVAAHHTLSEAHPERFILGLGVSHSRLVTDNRGLQYHQPVQAMREYLAAMDQLGERYRAVRPSATTRLIGALGPRMLHLAATDADGAHTYLVPPEHTATARQILGPAKLLVPEQAVVLDTDQTRARDIARQHVRRYPFPAQLHRQPAPPRLRDRGLRTPRQRPADRRGRRLGRRGGHRRSHRTTSAGRR